MAGFQSTPVIANGRIHPEQFRFSSTGCFNPRPLLLTGESWDHDQSQALSHLFQSTPVIANGRISLRLFWLVFLFGFNPRPLLLTGESRPWPTAAAHYTVVSIHARYC